MVKHPRPPPPSPPLLNLGLSDSEEGRIQIQCQPPGNLEVSDRYYLSYLPSGLFINDKDPLYPYPSVGFYSLRRPGFNKKTIFSFYTRDYSLNLYLLVCHNGSPTPNFISSCLLRGILHKSFHIRVHIQKELISDLHRFFKRDKCCNWMIASD